MMVIMMMLLYTYFISPGGNKEERSVQRVLDLLHLHVHLVHLVPRPGQSQAFALHPQPELGRLAPGWLRHGDWLRLLLRLKQSLDGAGHSQD